MVNLNNFSKKYLVVGIVLFLTGILAKGQDVTFNKYHKPEEVLELLQIFQNNNPGKTKIHKIAESPGGTAVSILEIGSNLSDVPAVFAGANFEGNNPLATEGALRLAKMLLDSADYASNRKWFIMPLPNPDAAGEFFSAVKYNRTVNDFQINNDVDESMGEDGFDDLNGDGFITKMRVKDPEGKYILSKNDSRILVQADAKKGERGEYKLYSEGKDNDGDNKYNEDGKGGINVGISFPHLFPKWNKDAGLWSGQTPEVYGILRFIYDRPEIAMVFTLGSSDFCTKPPKGGRKGDANLEKLKFPSRYAKRFGVDENKTFTMDEAIEIVQEQVPAGMEITPSRIAGIFGLGAAVNPLKDDLKFYKKFAEEYKEFLKNRKFNTETIDPEPAKNGSFELWAYYHLGLPSFSMNLFSVPKVKEEKAKDGKKLSLEEVEKMNSEEFTALGEEKIGNFLKENNAPEQYNAKGIIEMMDSGKTTPKQLAGMIKNMPKKEKEDELSEKNKALLDWSDKEWNGNGFVNWETYSHPQLGEVEIGGFVPYLETTPKPERIDSLLQIQLPWLLQLSEKLPKIEWQKEKVTDLGAGVYKLELYVENNGILPYPIAMGGRNEQPAPVIIVLDGEMEILEGTSRTPLRSIGANQVKKLEWLIKAKKGTSVSAIIESAMFSDKSKQFKIGG